MNLKEKMGRTFQDFWNLNIGHCAIIVVFVFGLGISWEKASDKIDRVQDSVTIKHEAALSAIAVSANERDLKFNALTERIVRDEAQVAMVSDLRISVAMIATEMKGLNAQLGAFRQELQDRKKPE